MKLSGWGRFPVIEADVRAPRSPEEARDLVLAGGPLIARGNGRAYGDSAIGTGTGTTLSTRHLDRMLAFDPATGQLVAEAGVILGDIIATFLPRGWFPMVSPGTKFVSLGGAIAADVHGKNHHVDGSFRSCVDWIDVLGADGAVMRCSREEQPDLFDLTLGGMGLTGVILRAAFRLRPVESAWIRQETRPTPSLSATLAAFEESQGATYSVAWIDCLAKEKSLGRSIIMLGEHARVDELPKARAHAPFAVPAKRKLAVPLDLPGFVLNSLAMRAFNSLYYAAGSAKQGTGLVDWDSYFYPLDAILGWNRIYGRTGFAQFQCVLPLGTAEAGLTALLTATSDAGAGSFLAVLKRFGAQDSAFSFPCEGLTLALDFPISGRTLALLEMLDRITLDHGGRFYLAKDSRMSHRTLSASDPRAENFRAIRSRQAWAGAFRSAQSERLSL